MSKKAYLGDGVYIDRYEGSLVMTTENGIRATNTIYLDGEVLEAFLDYLKKEEIINSYDWVRAPGEP